MILHGLDVVVSPDIPKMKLAPGDYVTPAYRAEIDAWLLSFFGATNLVEDGKALVMQSTRRVWMNPRTYTEFKNQTSSGSSHEQAI